MAFPGSTFGLWNDADCTSAFSGTLTLLEYTDLSDNPQDFLLYLGSTASDRALQAASTPGVDDLVLTPVSVTPEWQASHSYTLGKIIVPTVDNGYVYICDSAGTSGGSEPTWPTVGLGSTVADGSCLWALYAVHHPATEIKLAITSGGLDSATGGAALALGPTIDSLAVNAVPVYIRITNTVTTVSNNTGNPEIGLSLNAAVEMGV